MATIYNSHQISKIINSSHIVRRTDKGLIGRLNLKIFKFEIIMVLLTNARVSIPVLKYVKIFSLLFGGSEF